MGYRDGNWDVPDPGSQGGPHASTMTLRCAQCAWSCTAVSPVSAGMAHHAQTGHPIAFRGLVQAWSASTDQKGAA